MSAFTAENLAIVKLKTDWNAKINSRTWRPGWVTWPRRASTRIASPKSFVARPTGSSSPSRKSTRSSDSSRSRSSSRETRCGSWRAASPHSLSGTARLSRSVVLSDTYQIRADNVTGDIMKIHLDYYLQSHQKAILYCKIILKISD